MDVLSVIIDLERVVRMMDTSVIGVWGYVVLFGLLFLCGVGLPVPEDIPLLVAGMLVGHGEMNLLVAAVCAWCGIIGGDCVLYFLARRHGLKITRLPLVGKHFTKERIERAELLFTRWGIWVVAIGRLFAGVRGAMVAAAGTIRFNFVKFVIADGLAALISGGMFVWLGIKFGENLPWIKHKINEYSTAVFIGVVTAVVLFVAYRLWRRRTGKGMTDVATAAAVEVAEHGLHLPHPHAHARADGAPEPQKPADPAPPGRGAGPVDSAVK